VSGRGSAESAAHAFAPGDRVITRVALAAALRDLETAGNQALVVRTTPNGEDKRMRRYEGESPAPFLTLEAARYLVELGIEHLLVDLPSIDRAQDGGLLAAHRLLLGPAGRKPQRRARRTARRPTITELVYVPDGVDDGLYLMSLQVPAFAGDAAPSRPLLYPATLEADA
jgi:hypothetical protein